MNVADVNDAPVAVNDTFNVSKNSTRHLAQCARQRHARRRYGRNAACFRRRHGQPGRHDHHRDGRQERSLHAEGQLQRHGNVHLHDQRSRGRHSGGLTSQGTVTVNVSGLTATNDSGTASRRRRQRAPRRSTCSPTTRSIHKPAARSPSPPSARPITAARSPSRKTARASATRPPQLPRHGKIHLYDQRRPGAHARPPVTMTINNVNDPPTGHERHAHRIQGHHRDVRRAGQRHFWPRSDRRRSRSTPIAHAARPRHRRRVDRRQECSYTPTSGYTGADSFTYKIKDAGGAHRHRHGQHHRSGLPAEQLSGFVYFDVNNNGIKDAGELPIVGVTITLTGTATAGTNTSRQSDRQDARRRLYKFENLAPGTYQIKETQPQFVIDGKATAGSQGGTVTANQIAITNWRRTRPAPTTTSASSAANSRPFRSAISSPPLRETMPTPPSTPPAPSCGTRSAAPSGQARRTPSPCRTASRKSSSTAPIGVANDQRPSTPICPSICPASERQQAVLHSRIAGGNRRQQLGQTQPLRSALPTPIPRRQHGPHHYRGQRRAEKRHRRRRQNAHRQRRHVSRATAR